MTSLVKICKELDNHIYRIDAQIKRIHALPVDFRRHGVWQEIINRYDMTRIQIRTVRRLVQEKIDEQDKIRTDQDDVHTD